MQDRAVGRLDEAEAVDPGEGTHVADQPDVRPLRRLDGTDAAVVAKVHIAHFHPSPLPLQATRAQRAQAALVGQFRKGIDLIHELAQLAAPHELAHGPQHQLGVHQLGRHHLFGIAHRHSVAHALFQPRQSHPDLALQQLADRIHATVTQMIHHVRIDLTVVDPDHAPHDVQEVLTGQDPLFHALRPLEALVQLVATDLAQVVPARVEELLLNESPCSLRLGRITGPLRAVEANLGILDPLLAVDHRGQRILLQRCLNEAVLFVRVHVLEQRADFLVRAVTQGANQDRHRLLALAIHLDRDFIALRGFKFQPGAPTGDHLGGR